MDKLDSYHLPVTGRNILRFAFPTIVMTVFNTFYTMVDGLFVSNLIGMEALSAINLTAPAIALITAISGMLATGGSAVVMKKMGEHREQEARQDFTLLILTNVVVGALMMLLGYPFILNFNDPYASKSISEFYRRWHVTLGKWFREYVYIPLGGSRCSKRRLILNLALVWLLTGIWHGNGINYLIWGGVIGGIIILEKTVYGKYLRKTPVLGNLYVLLLIPLTWVVFAVTDLHQLGVYFGRLFPLIGGAGIAVNEQDIIKYLRDYSLYFIAGISLCIPAMPRFWKKHRNHPLVLFLLALIFWMSVYYQSNSAGNPFMYLKF